MKAYAVIGANWGDEGKGIITDWLCSKQEKLGIVVRFNGGAQAGHTVEANGQRRVFHHIGSGSINWWSTYLGPDFICNPLMFDDEIRGMAELPKVLVSTQCLVTTPYDMLINRAVETARGASRHGSCGTGINETVERSLVDRFRITVGDLGDHLKTAQKLLLIGREWAPARMAQLGLESPLTVYQDMLDDFCHAVGAFLARIDRIVSQKQALRNEIVVFEGAQGLALDEHSPDFPYVTRSSTGLRNVLKIAAEVGITEIEAIYVTRAYFTRHGAGPLPGETEYAVWDQTNVENEFQGALRFAPMDPGILWKRIAADLELATDTGITVTPRLAVTCVDHVKRNFPYIVEGREIEADIHGEEIAKFISNLSAMGNGKIRPLPPIYSDGPKRTNVHRTEPEPAVKPERRCHECGSLLKAEV